MPRQLESPELYTIAWIAALPIERAAATALLEEIHKEPGGFTQNATDSNSYRWGRLGEHNIVIASLPAGVYGTTPAAMAASDLIHSLPHIRFGLLVGIGGGISNPDEDQDIRLGDVVVSQPEGTTGGVVQYDFLKAKVGGVLEQKGSLNKPPPVLLHALASLQAQHEMMPSRIPELLEAMWNKNNRYMTKKKTNYTYPGMRKDRLFKSEHNHIGGPTCANCDPEWEVEREERDSANPEIHYGIIASGNTLIKDAAFRDSLSERHQFLCVEMEASGLMDRFPCLVIRGICDYADSHKNDGWQRYAAATAAAFAVELLEHVPVKKVQETQQVIELVRGIEDKITQVEDGMNKLGVSIDNIDLNIVLDRLPDAAGARFDSQAEEHNPKCLVNTRVVLLQEISSWITDEASKPVMWLNGMAGTGKSTIARTVAIDRFDHGDLGASFFFKRGEADRGSLLRFVPSIGRQLARNIPGFALQVKDALDSDPDITSKSVAKQFAALIEAPIEQLIKTSKRPSAFALIVDALDECEGDEEIRSLIHILSRPSSVQRCLRIFITSRPDLPIRLGFAKASGTYRALILHDMPAVTIKHDIMTFLLVEFERIRDDFNSLVPEELKLPPRWPGEVAINKLTNMALPLFIFAATVCRFVKDYKVDNPSDRLFKYFQLSNNNYGTHLGQTYGPVLQSIVTGVSEDDHRQIVEQTRHIVGSIVMLATPLSVMGISKLLHVSVNVVHSRLNALHSVLNIPPNLDEPVRLLHISFRDYLIDSNQSDKNEFWVDEQHVHLELLRQSLRVMENNLKEDICRLGWPGTERKDAPSSQIAYCIPDELQYACRHWVYHLQKVRNPSLNEEEVFMFLQAHLFHWLEVLSLLGRFKESFQAIKSLKTIIKGEHNNKLGQILSEVLRFLQINSTIIDTHPLQLYSSLLYSIPSSSMLDRMVTNRHPQWLQHAPEPSKTSDQAKYILEGHETPIGRCEMSLDNSRLVSCSNDGSEMRVWHLETGDCIRVITDEDRISPYKFIFSYDGSWIAACTNWNGHLTPRSEEGEFICNNKETLQPSIEQDSDACSGGDSGARSTVDSESSGNEDSESSGNEDSGARSTIDSESSGNEDSGARSTIDSESSGDEDSDTISDHDPSGAAVLKLWNVDSQRFIETLHVQFCEYEGESFRFSPDSKLFVFIDHTGAALVRQLDGAEPPRERFLAYRETGRKRFRPYRIAEDQDDLPLYYIEFSPDSCFVTIMSVKTRTYAVWETGTFECIRYQKMAWFSRYIFYRGRMDAVAMSVALTKDATILIAGVLSDDIWSPSGGGNDGRLEIRWLDSGVIISTINCQYTVSMTQFSADQTVLAAIFEHGYVGTWRVNTGECLTMSQPQSWFAGLSLSPNLDLISSVERTKTASVWANLSKQTEERPRTSDPISLVTLSSDHMLAASCSHRGSVKVWDTNTCSCMFEFGADLQSRTLFDRTTVDLLHFTKDNCYLFAACAKALEDTSSAATWDGLVRGWNLNTGQNIITLQTRCHAENYYRGSAVSVAPDDSQIVSVNDTNVTISSIHTCSIIRVVTFPRPICDIAISPDSEHIFVLLSERETFEIPRGRGDDMRYVGHEISLATFATSEINHPVSIRMPKGVQGILAVSLDSSFLVLQTWYGRKFLVAPAIFSDKVKLLYEFPGPDTSDVSPNPVSLTEHDSDLVSYRTPFLDVRDSLTGQVIRRLKVDFGSAPRRLRFDADARQIHTNFGTVAIDQNSTDELFDGFTIDKHLTGYGISSDRSWLLWKDKKIFWLQPVFRPNHCSTIEVFDSTIIIGTENGRVLFFKFNSQDGAQPFQ